jgi:hypothetical protein
MIVQNFGLQGELNDSIKSYGLLNAFPKLEFIFHFQPIP